MKNNYWYPTVDQPVLSWGFDLPDEYKSGEQIIKFVQKILEIGFNTGIYAVENFEEKLALYVKKRLGSKEADFFALEGGELRETLGTEVYTITDAYGENQVIERTKVVDFYSFMKDIKHPII